MTTVNIDDAKARLSALIAEVEAGGDVVITRAGQPVARLVRIEAGAVPRVPGRSKGRIHMTDDFDAPLEDTEARMA